MEKLFKVLNEDGTPVYGRGQWSLPKGDRPGEWMPSVEGKLIPCQTGYHLCREEDLIHWLGPAIYEAEYRGDRVDDDNKVVVREARLLRRIEGWNEQAARLFACDCAERTLHFYEESYPDDNRPRQCIEVARRFARGEATQSEMAAARAAAWDAARAAAWAAARAAAWAAARAAARDAAWDAASDAASDAAYDAAYAARDAERWWQTTRLMDYLGLSAPAGGLEGV